MTEANKSVDSLWGGPQSHRSLLADMPATTIPTPILAEGAPTILPFPTEPARPARTSRPMTTQLLQEAAQVIPNQQLLINVVSKRVRQLGLGHRPLVEATPRSSLTDIALREIIAGKLTYEADTDGNAAEENA